MALRIWLLGPSDQREGKERKRRKALIFLSPACHLALPQCLVSTGWPFPTAPCEELFHTDMSGTIWLPLGIRSHSCHCRTPCFLLFVCSPSWHVALLDEVLSTSLEPGSLLGFHLAYGKLTHPSPLPASLWGAGCPVLTLLSRAAPIRLCSLL